MKFRDVTLAAIAALALLGTDSQTARAEVDSTALQPFVPPTYEYQQLENQRQLADYWQQVGANAVVVGDYPNALTALSKAVDLTSASEPELLEQRGWVYYRLGNESIAAADFRTAAALYLSEQHYDAYVNTQHMLDFLNS
ncbi:tetratricopeptide repeat protein [Leptolyngbya cf. ectocarpi LEGE 11479]|uniref:Tetratricopeptide repeat protein n=1 Tax=Leptolyngbya cf. ectocarpi LEGE 11479 TaxID=1828722 RepID=A0A928ZXB3_LEPEC|nr:tetratricopeptide repeat protein [Leptolyngbya ectocarpi]MBE9069160.1 tetratricopeptide repeat protein [Leptolyngbya cf. ectocarpi LEGE 11479]